ncbi:GNAT family N-acetyltransferase [Kiloniella laminariae]|uniref:GNAT family N-acetyltransferase n=1 Tax=Kiloniella laminariae TaxID=454162 RepID=A0ABT4LDK2_9PROT|nr:GNAT family N-acetyltransferase [Kiloniella laminariae]MCZ4279172.1 GNAT family N-acetyltransferase [Kiloniella laminariae]
MSDSSEKIFEIRHANEEDVQIFCDWAAMEGWNPGLRDIQCFYGADKSGFYIGWLGPEPVACISAVKYGTSHGFIGFYIVREDQRGKGYGLKIWNHAMASLEGRIIGLDGVVDQQDNYAKSGFALAYRNIRFEGVAPDLAHSDKEGRISVSDTRGVPQHLLVDYDRLHFFTERKAFLSCWLKGEGHEGLAILEQGKVVGYGVMRPYADGYKIGPLFAENVLIADELFQAFCHKIPGSNIILDVPEENIAAVELARRYQLKQSFETARMYRNGMADLPLAQIFGVTSFELG